VSPQTKRFVYSMVELAVYVGVLVILTDSMRQEQLRDRLAEIRNRLRFEADVADTLEQIRALPEE